jgi:O-antigen/teichoic acid export membrane protein
MGTYKLKMKIKELMQIMKKPQEHSLKLQSIRAGFWGFLSKGGEQVLRFISNLVLTRLLFPEAFGLMAIANTTLMLVNLFSDTGIKTSIIQNPKGDDPEFLNTAWVISICRGCLLCVIIVCLSWPLAKFYNEPALKYILLMMSLNPFITSFENPSLSLLVKKFRVDTLAFFETGLQIISFVTLLVLVYIFRNVDALVIGTVLGSLYRTIGSFLIAKPLPKFSWDSKAGAAIFHFGKFIFLNTMFTWAAFNADIVIIGKLLGMDILAFYNIGKNLSYLPFIFFIQLVSQSYFPAISSVSNDFPRVIKMYRKTITFFLAVSMPIGIWLSVFSHDIIKLFYDPRYETAYISMYWLSLCIIFRMIGAINGTTFFALGKPFYETISNLIGLVITIILLGIGAKLGGFAGAAIGMAMSLSLTPVIESIFLFKIMKFPSLVILMPWIQAIAGSLCIITLSKFIKTHFFNDRFYNIPFIIMIVVLSAAISFAIYALLERKNVTQ